MIYFGAVDREWAQLTGSVNHQIEKLGKQGLLVAKKADNTCDSIGMLSPSEKQTGNFTHCFCIWLVKGPDHFFLSSNFCLQPRRIYRFLHFTVFWGVTVLVECFTWCL